MKCCFCCCCCYCCCCCCCCSCCCSCCCLCQKATFKGWLKLDQEQLKYCWRWVYGGWLGGGWWCKVIFMSTSNLDLLGWVELRLSWGCDNSGLNQEPTRKKASQLGTLFGEFSSSWYPVRYPFSDFLIPPGTSGLKFLVQTGSSCLLQELLGFNQKVFGVK